VKVLSFRVTQYFADEINQILDLAVSVQLLPFDDDHHTDHVACT
jgi:hypothetical protein